MNNAEEKVFSEAFKKFSVRYGTSYVVVSEYGAREIVNAVLSSIDVQQVNSENDTKDDVCYRKPCVDGRDAWDTQCGDCVDRIMARNENGKCTNCGKRITVSNDTQEGKQ
jgi:hypothetical protein